MNSSRFVIAAAGALVAQASGVVVPFTETFSSPAANWSSSSVYTPLTYVGSGGPDGSGYGSQQTSFANSAPFAQPLLFRGQGNFGSSGNAFVGDWIAADVTQFSFSVRHNAPTSIDFFARFAPAFGGGAVGLTPVSVAPNTWTTFSIAIDPMNPAIIYEGTSFAIFGAISRVQVGVLVPTDLAGRPETFTFDIDNVGIIPAPGAGLGLVLGGLLMTRRRR